MLNISNKTARRFFQACLVTATVAGMGSAVAGTPSIVDHAPAVTVRYDDLNLASHSGMVQLYRRITAAANQVCPAAGSRELSALAASQKCRTEAIQRAVNDVHNTQFALQYAKLSPQG
ncbi:MAG TPA: UrcA family protein [Steroidobacteraceae bacterium]|nr:UrcA family protein [Steroidobacteraceae bacterium]